MDNALILEIVSLTCPKEKEDLQKALRTIVSVVLPCDCELEQAIKKASAQIEHNDELLIWRCLWQHCWIIGGPGEIVILGPVTRGGVRRLAPKLDEGNASRRQGLHPLIAA